MGPLSPPTYNALVVRPHIRVTAEAREAVLRSVEYNVFSFPAALVTCDFLSDSGTSAMTDVQWAAMLRGDESYGRNSGYYCLLEAFRDIFERGEARKYAYRDLLAGTLDSKFFIDALLQEHGNGFVNGGPLQLERPNFFIVPQGRCAEALLFSTLSDVLDARGKDDKSRYTVLSNGFFDTTGANISVAGFELQTFTQKGLTDAFPVELVGRTNPFKGNLDIEAASAFLQDNSHRVTMLLLTITNNWAAAQPVSMRNIQQSADLAQKHGIPLLFDACRFAENAKFIQDFEDGYGGKSIPEIVREMFSYADGFTISLKKDGLANMGGALCFRDQGIFATSFPEIGHRLKERQILCYGNDSYGGMSGRDLMAAAVGLYEVTKEYYLANRIGQVQRFAEKLVSKGIPLLLPPGGHAIYLDMDGFFQDCERSYGDFAGLGFTLELLGRYGVRAAEAGPFGWEWDKKTEEERKLIPNLVRFAVPRYVMTNDHLDYTVEAIAELHARRHTIPGVEITRGKDMRIRHFSAALRPVPVQSAASSLTELGTYLSEAQRDLLRLSTALGFENHWEALKEALQVSLHPWGDSVIQNQAGGWLSDVSLDHSPIEYSVALEQRTGAAQLRFMVESQAVENSIDAFQGGAVNLTTAIKEKYPSVSLDRFHSIRDLFFPSQASGPFAAWHSFALTDSGEASWKIYLNPSCLGEGQAANVTCEAFSRLGMSDAWDILESLCDSETDRFIYFSLDLFSGSKARVKVYVQHKDATHRSIGEKMASVASDAPSPAQIRDFCNAMSGGSDGPYSSKPLITTFGFTRNENGGGLEVETVLHFPVSHYASDDAEIRRRVEGFLSTWSGADDRGNSPLKKYQACIDAAAHRKLEGGRGIHAWVGLKASRLHGPVLTFYLEPEMLKVLPVL